MPMITYARLSLILKVIYELLSTEGEELGLWLSIVSVSSVDCVSYFLRRQNKWHHTTCYIHETTLALASLGGTVHQVYALRQSD